MLSFYSESVLPGASYAGMAFDGFSFFLPLRGRAQVTVLSQTLTPIEKLKTRREYSKICYDRKRGCFWALSPRRRNALFRPTPDFEEVREFTVCAPECFKTP